MRLLAQNSRPGLGYSRDPIGVMENKVCVLSVWGFGGSGSQSSVGRPRVLEFTSGLS